MGQCKYGFTPDPKCDNCDGDGEFAEGEPCHFCLSAAIRRGELNGAADGITYRNGRVVPSRCPLCGGTEIMVALAEWFAHSMEPQDVMNAGMLDEHQCQTCARSWWS